MEPYNKDICDITYMPELIPSNANLKVSCEGSLASNQ